MIITTDIKNYKQLLITLFKTHSYVINGVTYDFDIIVKELECDYYKYVKLYFHVKKETFHISTFLKNRQEKIIFYKEYLRKLKLKKLK